jgi:D-glycero-alpha-D-manno-heptose-7-phosphate kinase
MIVRARAPLRLGLAGGGTDVSPYSETYGGRVLNATVGLYAYCTLEPSPDGSLELRATDRGETFRAAAGAELDATGTLALHKGIVSRLARQFPGAGPLAVRVTTHADVSAGSGLGTSSTLVVAILQAFNEWLHLGLGEYDVAHLAYEIEREDVGLSGGKQDQYAAAFGGFNFMEFGESGRVVVNPLRVKDWIVNELEASTVLYHTGQSRDSARIIDEQVANAAAPTSPSVEAMHRLREDAVVMKEQLLAGDLRGFSERLGHSWEAKKRLAHSVTNPTIEDAFAAALAAGAHAGKVSGAGGGGVAMFLMEPSRKPAVLAALASLPGRVLPFHFVQRGAEAWRPDPARRARGGPWTP